MKIESIDHLVLTVRDTETSCRFYCDVLGMEAVKFNGDRWALKFGQQKINLHPMLNSISPRAKNPAPGSTDLCLLTSTPINDVIATLNQCNAKIIEGPVPRTGAIGDLISVYVRDPDENLVEISNRL